MRKRLVIVLGIPVIAAAAAFGGLRIASAGSAVNTVTQGIASPQLVAACAGTHVWAVVNSNGTLARHSSACGGTTSSAAGAGDYDVFFPRNVVNCAYVVTLGSSGRSGTVAPGYAVVVGAAGTTNGVFIQTFNSSGNVTAEGFHLVVDC